jgi:hypothetical protein
MVVEAAGAGVAEFVDCRTEIKLRIEAMTEECEDHSTDAPAWKGTVGSAPQGDRSTTVADARRRSLPASPLTSIAGVRSRPGRTATHPLGARVTGD